MCRKFRFILDIEQKKVCDYVAYAARLRRVYMIFGVIAIINIVSTFKDEDHVIRLLQIFGIILYGNIALVLSVMQNVQHTDMVLRRLIVATNLLLVLNTMSNATQLIYLLAYYYSWTLLFNIFSIILHLGSLYIFYRFKIQFDVEKDSSQASELASVGVAAPVATPMIHAVPEATAYPVNDKV